MKIIVLVACIALVAITGFATAKVTTTTDRFTGKTTIMLMPDHPNVEGGIDLVVIVNVDSGKPLSSQSALLDLVSVHDSWKYLDCHSAHWLADGKKVATPDAEHSGKVGDGYVIEHVMQVVPFSTIETFAGSNSVEYEVCNDPGKLRAHEISEIKELVSKVKAATSAP